MSTTKARFENMVYAESSIYSSDYRNRGFQQAKPTEFTPRTKRKGPAGCYRLKDLETLSERKAGVDFDVAIKPRPIVNTSPWVEQKKYTGTEENNNEAAIKTRPRLIISPALSLDDMADARTRRILVDCTYTSDARAASRPIAELFAAVGDKTRAPLPALPAPANPIILARLKPPLVSPEWRRDTLQWDNKQLRSHCESTPRFWLAFGQCIRIRNSWRVAVDNTVQQKD